MINQEINKLINYGLSKELITKDDQVYLLNKIGNLFNLEDVYIEETEETPLKDILDALSKLAVEEKIIGDYSFMEKQKFEAQLMDYLLPRPSELNKMFRAKYRKSPQQATQFFYDFSSNSHYIKTNPKENNQKFLYTSQYGDLEIIVNKAKNKSFKNKQVNSFLNHRQASISVNNEKNAWALQFLPYPLLEEQCLISRKDHLEPYNNDKTYEELIDFINKFPQYFVMSDMGNSLNKSGQLLYHYFEAGKHVFPIESADVIRKYKNGRVRIEVLNWPVSAVRLIGNNENKLLDIMHDLHKNWINYSNETLKIKAQTNEESHNIIDTLVKLDGSKFNVYMVFKNNRKTDEFPQGIFQLNSESMFIDFGILQDLGVIEIPHTLYNDLELIKKVLLNEEDISNYPKLKYLKDWVDSLKNKERPDDFDSFLINQLGFMFEKSLESTNVFKFGKKEDFIAFIEKAV